MKQEISALMDGELFEDEVGSLLDRAKHDEAGQKDWETYHLIGDVLRQPEHIHCDLSARVRNRMRDEPTVLAPRGAAVKQKVRAFALSAAASLLAIGVVAWMSLQISPEATPQMAMQQVDSGRAHLKAQANDYLMAHQEFSPSTDMKGGASYIQSVSYGSDERQPQAKQPLAK